MSAAVPAIEGECDARFGRVREAFARNFAEAGEAGASVAVALDGELAVDLWAGRADREGARPWRRDTVVCVYSTTKGMVALAAHLLAERGLLDLEAPVAAVWPEFARAGKERLPVRQLLTHEAGLPVIDADLPAGAELDWATMTDALARQAPVWPPGERQGYHTATFGWLVGEVVRRASGRTVGTFIREEIAGPLGVDFLLGFGPEEDGRVADLLRARGATPAASSALAKAMADPHSLTARSFNLAPGGPGKGPNSRAFRTSEQPSANGHTNARALAAIYGALAAGGVWRGHRLARADTVRRMAEARTLGEDAILRMPVRRSLGFMLPVQGTGDARGPNAFGHAGMGGSLGFADPDAGIGFGYAMNQLWASTLDGDDPRADRLARAVYASLG